MTSTGSVDDDKDEDAEGRVWEVFNDAIEDSDEASGFKEFADTADPSPLS